MKHHHHALIRRRAPGALLGALCLAALATANLPAASAQDAGSSAAATTTTSSSSAASAAASSDVALLRLLSAYHELPSKDAFVSASKSAEDDLQRLVRTKDLFQARRYRALEALATYWPGARTEEVFTELFGATTESDAAIHQLIVLSSKHLSSSVAIGLIAPYLDASDEQVRYTAVDGLGRIHTKESRELLAARRPRESSDWVKDHIDHMLIELH